MHGWLDGALRYAGLDRWLLAGWAAGPSDTRYDAIICSYSATTIAADGEARTGDRIDIHA